MNKIRLTTFLLSLILAGFVGVAHLASQDRDPFVPKRIDISGQWVSSSPLDGFVNDDSKQPVNTFRIERSKVADFDAQYIGSRSTAVNLKWVEKTHRFEGTIQAFNGPVIFRVTPTEELDVLKCEIASDANGQNDPFQHKDTWTRVRAETDAPRFKESLDLILTETKEGLVAYNKLTGNWAKLEIPEPNDRTTRLKNCSLSTGFACAKINGELLGYCNRLSRWSKLKIPAEHQGSIKIHHSATAVSATIGDQLYILSASTGEWETPEMAQAAMQRLLSDEKLADRTTGESRAAVNRVGVTAGPMADEQVRRATERYSNALKSANATNPTAAEARLELEKVLEEALEIKLKDEQERIADLKQRVRRLEKQVEQRIANRTSVIRKHIDELTEAVDKLSGELPPPAVKIEKSPAEPVRTAVLQYDDHEDLTPEMKAETEALLVPYMEHLKKLGFELQRGQVILRVQPDMNNAHYYQNNRSIVMDPRVVGDQSVMRREYNHHALAVALGPNAKEIFQTCSGIESGLSDYFGCSACNDPEVGREFERAIGANGDLRTMDNQRQFSEIKDESERHVVGEVVSGALWEMRKTIDKDVLDRLLYKSWVGIAKTDPAKGQILRFATSLLSAAEKESPELAKTIRAIFEQRGLKLR